MQPEAASILGLSLARVRSRFPEVMIHDDPAAIQEPDTLAYAVDPTGEFEIVFDAQGKADTVFIFRESRLLHGLPVSFSSRRAEIRSALGTSEATGRASVDPYLGAQGAWDRFAIGECVVHCQFQYRRSTLKQITVMTSAVAARSSSS